MEAEATSLGYCCWGSTADRHCTLEMAGTFSPPHYLQIVLWIVGIGQIMVRPAAHPQSCVVLLPTHDAEPRTQPACNFPSPYPRLSSSHACLP